MHRRQLLKSALTLPLLTLPRALTAAPAATQLRVRPADAAWPSAAEWQGLNAAVGGTLSPVQPLFAPCVSDAGSAACHEVLDNLRNPFYLGDQAAGTQVSGWLDAWTPAASAYAVRARSSADVAAAVNFAREHRLRLAVKGGGHSYQGTSNAPDSLLVWTRAMNRVTLHDSFVPRGCEGKQAAVPAVSCGAGAMWVDLYHAVTSQAGRYVQGGGCTTVGVAGLVQSGGFSSFSKRYGTAAASLLEAEIVTADGKVLTVNACSHPELFWALQGGGGGSWGVVTRLTLRTHPLPEFFGAAWGKVRAHSDAAFHRLLARFVDFYADNLFNPHWGEQVEVGAHTLKLSMVSQGLDAAATQQLWAPFFAAIKAAPADFTLIEPFGVGALPAKSWWEPGGTHRMIADRRPGAPDYHVYWQGDQGQVGAFLHGYDSLWLPATLLAPEQRPRLAAALFAGSRHKEIGLHFNKGLAGAPAEAVTGALATATNPAVAQAFALAIIADDEPPAYPGMPHRSINKAAARSDARAITRSAAELHRIVPNAGSYVSESDFFNRSWQQAFWGENYRRLRTVKDQYDPQGVFFGHHGVGSEDWSADGFSRVKS
jgi:FAD/FMN-containing dehydrogenase